jgi:hypothetical protein
MRESPGDGFSVQKWRKNAMCLITSGVLPTSGWNWAGDAIVNNPTVRRGRRIPGTSKEFAIDIREYLAAPQNSVIRDAVSELVSALPSEQRGLVTSSHPNAFDTRACAVLDFLARKVKYIPRRGDSYDTWMFPDETLANGGGDCEDLAFLLASLLIGTGISGYVVRVVLGQVRVSRGADRPAHDHAWVMYLSESGSWLLLDPLLHTAQAERHRRRLHAESPPDIAIDGKSYEYVPCFVFNDSHLWEVRHSDNHMGLGEYLDSRRFWSTFDPEFGVQAHNTTFDASLRSFFTSGELTFIKQTSLAVDVNFPAYDPRDHFDSAYLEESWERVQRRLATGNLHDFALACHSIGDFYAHSSYGHFALQNNTIPIFDIDRFGNAPAGALSTPPEYRTAPFDLASGEFSVNPALWKQDGAAAAEKWRGRLLSGRFAQNGDPKQGWLDMERLTYIPKELRTRADYPARGGLPHHDEIAVDEPSPKSSHALYKNSGTYFTQFKARVAVTTEHLRQVGAKWSTQHKPQSPTPV